MIEITEKEASTLLQAMFNLRKGVLYTTAITKSQVTDALNTMSNIERKIKNELYKSKRYDEDE